MEINMYSFALFLLFHGHITREPAADFNQQFVGHWEVAASSCGKALTLEEAREAIKKKQSLSHGGHIVLQSDGTYSQVSSASRICKKDPSEREAIYMEGVYCGDDAQTDGKYEFFKNGNVNFDGKLVKRAATNLIAGIGLDEGWKKLKWKKKDEDILVLIFPSLINLSNCSDQTMYRYYVKFRGA